MKYSATPALNAPRQSRQEAHGGSELADEIVWALEAAPFGFGIRSRDGRSIFANAVARDGLQGKPKSYAVATHGATYTIDLSLEDAAENLQREELFRKAYFDDVTGLPNRAVLETSVSALIEEEGASFVLAFIDLDRFRQINDHFGLATGDMLLSKVANRISDELGAADLLTRLANNSFVLLLSRRGDVEPSERLAGISRRISEPFFVDGQEVFTSASIGASCFPEDGADFATLHWNAERAMRGARADAPGGVKFYHRAIDRLSAAKSRAEQRLRQAIRDRRVSCAFQPKVDLSTGEVRGVEALMRWRDDTGVLRAPGSMLAIASDLGLIDDVTQMVLDETILSVDRILDAFGEECSISVNVAARQAGNERFMRSFVDQLESTGFVRRFLVEVTEEAFLATGNFQRRILPMIREAGARVSIDDFGTGFSSLSALADITADEVKIDRSFVTNVQTRPRSQNVLRAIEALGHSLGMTMVVEGVETLEEVEYLRRETRIQLAQGYYFAHPATFDELVRQSTFGGQPDAGGPRLQMDTRKAAASRR